MAHNFLRAERDQPFLLPPDLRDWLPQDHLAWFILDVVDQLDLQPFYRQHRDDGHGHPAYDPKTLLGVLLYGYCLGVRSSRQLERRLHEDLAFRVLAANQTPDHVTIARFRARHETALAGFLVASLKLCAAAGMVHVGTVALDGTKLAGNAADKANRTHDKINTEVAEILRQAAETDQREDRQFGDARGDELPPALASKADRLARLRQAKARLEADAAAREQAYQQRVAAHTAAAKAKGRTPRQLKRRPQETPNPDATANVTDPDSRFLHTRNGTLQGYNAQAVTTLEQVIVAAELTCEANDVHQLEPMLTATSTTLAAAGIDERPEAALADSGYWSIENVTAIPDAPELLIPPARHGRQGKPRKDGKPSASRSDGLRAAMTAKLRSEDGKARYAKRRETVEPAFGQIKEQQGARRFLRRGMRACDAEWKLLCGTHNLLKLWRHTITQQAASPATA
jgi:transposase